MSPRAFADQVEALIALDYPALLSIPSETFRQRLEPLAALLPEAGATTAGPEQGTIPFVLVIQRAIDRSEMLSRVSRRQKGAVERLDPRGIDDFQPIEGLHLPDADAYLLIGVDRGRDSLNMTPDDALPRLRERGRQPLTIDDGIHHSSGVAYERVLLEGASKRTKDSLVQAANRLLPIFVEHALWRPKERAWIGNVMRETDIRRLQEDVRDGIRMASSMGLDVSDIRLPFAA